MKRLRTFAAWLAIAALLIDGMLPTAVTAMTPGGGQAPAAFCSGASGIPVPGKPPSSLPLRHCALCAAFFVALLPPRPGGLPARLVVGPAHPAAVAGIATLPGRVPYAAAQPRAPPVSA